MSYEAISWALNQPLKPFNSRLLIELCSHFNKGTGQCNPSISRLEKRLLSSRPSIVKGLKELESQGAITKSKNINSSTQYIIHTDRQLKNLTSKEYLAVKIFNQGSKDSLPAVVKNLNRGSKNSLPKTVIKQELETVKETDCAKAHVDDQNLSNMDRRGSVHDYYDKPPFAPDDISTKALEYRFDEFWANYPVKKDKKKARSKWLKIKPNQQLLEKMLRSIKIQDKEKQDRKQKTGFSPDWKHPTTWLNSESWEDEVYIPIENKDTGRRPDALANW